MTCFKLLTPLTYWILIALWVFILAFYIRLFRKDLIKGLSQEAEKKGRLEELVENRTKELRKEIDNRNQIEQDIIKNNEKLNIIFNSTPTILALVNEEGRVENINHKGIEFTGKVKDSLLGFLSGEVFNCLNSFDGKGCGRNPACPECPIRTRIMSTFKTREQHIEEEGQMTFLFNGIEKTMDILISTSLLDMGDNKKVLLSITDITERKQTENSLRESKKFLTATLDGLSANIALLDSDGQILLVNKSWKEFAETNGLSADQVSEGKNYLQVCDNAHGKHSQEAILCSTGIRSVLSGEKDFFELEYPCHSPNEERWFIVRITIFPGNGPRRVVIAHENITERVLSNEELRISEERFSKVFHTSPDSINLNRLKDGMYLEINQGYTKIMGYTREEVIGKSSLDLNWGV